MSRFAIICVALFWDIQWKNTWLQLAAAMQFVGNRTDLVYVFNIYNHRCISLSNPVFKR